MKKIIIILVILLSFSTALAAQQQLPQKPIPLNVELAVLKTTAKYGLSPFEDKFEGGMSSYIQIILVKPKGKTNIQKIEDLDKIIKIEDYHKIPDRTKYIIMVPAFMNNGKPMCYSQFKRLHYRLKNAKTLKIKSWRMMRLFGSSSTRIPPIVKTEREDGTIYIIHPSRILIIRTRNTIPK